MSDERKPRTGLKILLAFSTIGLLLGAGMCGFHRTSYPLDGQNIYGLMLIVGALLFLIATLARLFWLSRSER